MYEFRFAVCLVSAMMLPIAAPSRAAPPTPPATGGQIAPSEKASARQVTEFTQNPAGLLRTSPVGSMQMSVLVKSLLLADPNLLDTVLSIVSQGNRLQANSIGIGIGLAAKSLGDPASVDAVTRKVVARNDADLASGYTTALKQIATLAVGGGDTAGGGVGGGAGLSSTSSGGAGTPLASATSVVPIITTDAPLQLSYSATAPCTSTVSQSTRC